MLLGTGRCVGPKVPPGVSVGQYRVTTFAPGDCSPEDIIVSTNKDGTEVLSNVNVTVGISSIPWSATTGPVGGNRR